jgi:Zn-dependent protease with chaperone function
MLVMCVVFAPLTVGFITYALHETFAVSALGILLIVALAYTAMARGRLLGTSVRVQERQLPRIFAVVESCTKMLGVSMPAIFVREDLRVPLVAVGLREPYSLIVSTVWLPQLKDDELRFLVGRELGHIYARHTRLTSLLSPAGSDNPILGFVMGPWLRRTEYTADRVGLLCCGGYDPAMRAILTTQFQDVAGAIDPTPFAEQHDEIETDPSLRVGELISREPYATHRVHELRVFAASPLFEYWRLRLDAFAASVVRVAYKEPRGLLLPAVLVLDVALIGLIANYLKVSGRVSVRIDDADVPGLLAWFRAHAPWLARHLGPHPTLLGLGDFFTTGLSIAIALVIYIVIAFILRRTPGMFVFGLQWRTSPAVE